VYSIIGQYADECFFPDELYDDGDDFFSDDRDDYTLGDGKAENRSYQVQASFGITTFFLICTFMITLVFVKRRGMWYKESSVSRAAALEPGTPRPEEPVPSLSEVIPMAPVLYIMHPAMLVSASLVLQVNADWDEECVGTSSSLISDLENAYGSATRTYATNIGTVGAVFNILTMIAIICTQCAPLLTAPQNRFDRPHASHDVVRLPHAMRPPAERAGQPTHQPQDQMRSIELQLQDAMRRQAEMAAQPTHNNQDQMRQLTAQMAQMQAQLNPMRGRRPPASALPSYEQTANMNAPIATAYPMPHYSK
jgi:hypothetical protein